MCKKICLALLTMLLACNFKSFSQDMDKNIEKVAVIFEVTPTEEGTSKYFELGGILKEYLQKRPGFISVERFESVNNPGKYLSLSFWESEEAASGWRNQMNHRASQKQGYDKLFKDYRISVGHIVREYTKDDRTKAPADSNAALINE